MARRKRRGDFPASAVIMSERMEYLTECGLPTLSRGAENGKGEIGVTCEEGYD